MFEPTNLAMYVGKPLSELRNSSRVVEVYVFDHPAANCTLHFFKNKELHRSAKGVVVMRNTNIVDRILPGLAQIERNGSRLEFRADDCMKAIYAMIGEIAFRKWLADEDMREAMVKNQHSVVKLRDPLFYSLLVYYEVSRASRAPKKGLWPFKLITWDTDVRFQYRGKDRYARRRLTYIFADNPRQASKAVVEYRIAGSRRDNNLPDLTLARKYPITDWANTKTFMSQYENIPYLDAFFDEVDAKKK